MNDELDLLRQATEKSPILIWRENLEGDIIWSNSTYLLLAAENLLPGKSLTWPLPRLFDRVSPSIEMRNQRRSITLSLIHI